MFAMRRMSRPGSAFVTEAKRSTNPVRCGTPLRSTFDRSGGRQREVSSRFLAVFFEQAIGLAAHIKREMPLFLTLRDDEGIELATAMSPPCGKPDRSFGIIIVGRANTDPYPNYGRAIQALEAHFGIELGRAGCYPYARQPPRILRTSCARVRRPGQTSLDRRCLG